jgi:pyruvate dehydrogenase E2 component (dihydrolipoamide acetyltransferase)
MYGVDEFDAIINPPQCAIVAIGSAKPKVVVSRDRALRVATVLRATLSVDHRAIDGTTAAVFLNALRQHVEKPEHLVRSGQVDSARNC